MPYTTIDRPSDYFRVKTYSGSSSDGNAITWDETDNNMQPDWLWLKNRTAAQEHWLADSVRGTGKFLESNSTNAESSDGASGLASFDTNGFTLNDSARTNRNTMVGWGWLGGGTASSNSDGSVTSSVSANTTAGFSICTFTNPSSAANFTFGHGLGVAPRMFIMKGLNASNWQVYHESMGNTNMLQMNYTNAKSSAANWWGSTSPTSSVCTVGADFVETNQTSVAYVFAEKKGYSKFGSYTGNDNTDGTFVYTGFKPAWVMVKRTDATNYWFILDNKRTQSSGGNPIDQELYANATDVENDQIRFDFCANGFKNKAASAGSNGSGASYIYMAFSEAPFVNSNGVPATAR